MLAVWQNRGRVLFRFGLVYFGLYALATQIAGGLVIFASKVLTTPINNMIDVIRKVKRGRLDERMEVNSNDELGELANAFNRMTAMIKQNKEMEATLAQQGKMASLGILSSGVAHEINNPLGVILGCSPALGYDVSGWRGAQPIAWRRTAQSVQPSRPHACGKWHSYCGARSYGRLQRLAGEPAVSRRARPQARTRETLSR